MIGIIRKLDSLGRLTIPREYRNYLGIKENERMEIKVNEKNEIVITPVRKGN